LSANQAPTQSLGTILLIAFLGGLILNLMPCVLPVIGLKVMSFVQQAGESRARVFTLNLWYTLGLVSVFMVLATLAAVFNLGWGEQFNFDTFNITMVAVVFAMGLSFLGVWEIPIPGFVGSSKSHDIAEQEGPTGAFAKGIVTTLLATPCSGPGLATALAWCSNKPAPLVYMVFAVMGLGMASPYLIIAPIRGWCDSFPSRVRGWRRSSRSWALCCWDRGLHADVHSLVQRRADAGPAVLALGILLVDWADADNRGIPGPTTGLVDRRGVRLRDGAVCVQRTVVRRSIHAARPAGHYGLPTDLVRRQNASRASDSAGVTSGTGVKPTRAKSEAELPWEAFSAARLAQLTSEQKTVLVDFTADWCLTCKFLEHTVLNTEEVRRLVADHGIVTLSADWTDRNRRSARCWRRWVASKSR